MRPMFVGATLVLFAATPGYPQAVDRGGPARIAALAARGDLDGAEQAARAGGSSLATVLADVLVLRGRLSTADSIYGVVVAGNLPGHWAAEAGQAEIAARRGDRPNAKRHAGNVIAAYRQSGQGWGTTDKVAAARSYAVLGNWDPQALHNALTTFDQAAAADPTDIDSRLRAADLLISKYNAPDAQTSYAEVMTLAPANPRALLGLARVHAFLGDSLDPVPFLMSSLAGNPALVPAHVLLAQMNLQAESYDSARAAASRALAIDSSSVEAWAVLGAMAWLAGDSASYLRARTAAARINPLLTEFTASVAEAAARQRRYADAVILARQAVASDSMSSRAYGVLADNELRVGTMVQGRADLERAFVLDPYNLWHKNLLDLLDNLSTFKVVRTARFELVAPPEEADYLTLYLGPLLERGYDEFAARYGYRPPTPIRIELYRRHADFSVRTVGLTGIGALGVSFGTVLAIDAPSSRDPGEYNYGSTSWHELAHVFTLGLSRHRVPRWISEGLSVLEERRGGSGWGAALTMDYLAAYQAGRLPTASNINDGLMRPKFPEEIGLAYYEASLVGEMLEQEQGLPAIRALLQAYGEGLDTPAAFVRVLHMTAPEFDRHFDQWFKRRFATQLAAIGASGGQRITGDYATAMLRAESHFKSGQPDSARMELLRARAMFTDDPSPQGASATLARLDRDRGDLKSAVAELASVTGHDETAKEANTLEASLRLQLGDSAGVRAALDRLLWIVPYDVATHVRMAELTDAMGDTKRALLERRAVVALAPPDRLEARYQVARALWRTGDRDGARREILNVLELAPGFEKAQALLLQLQGGGGNPT